MSEYDRPGYFYLGKAYDIQADKVLEQPVLYDARDLTTHAVCVGMTGSGKTGLCTLMLEEVALNGVPSIIIDPKGDVTNLCLTFPELRPGDFEPWVNVDDARRKGLSVPDYAARMARTWADGLAQWGQGPERIRRLKASADFIIYTPGSDSGLPVSILDTMRAPKLSWEQESDILREKIASIVSALLGLIGIEADPLQSREHILLSNIFEHAWRRGEDLGIAPLIQCIQKPPVRNLGVFDVDTFFPQRERFELAMRLNNILAAPHFANWIQGQPMDIASILHTPEGKPRAAIFYIAHLDDRARMFFVTLLLEQVIAWMRAQSGTTSLRALLYVDETYGYFPPYPANPPSKGPLMTLLKQARAFGLGTILTTQNPVDLDYKGLTNAGTWFIGKLQTDRDKMRVLEGLEGAIQEAGTAMERRDYDRMISALDSRVFILHNVHEDRPQVFMTRWAMSYLRGPLTRIQVQQLMAGKREVLVESAPSAVVGVPAEAETLPAGLSTIPPQVDVAVPQYFLPLALSAEQAMHRERERGWTPLTSPQSQLVYEPVLAAWATVHYVDTRRNIEHRQSFRYLANPGSSATTAIDWEAAELAGDEEPNLDSESRPGAYFASLPEGLSQARRIKALEGALADYLYREKRLRLLRNPALGLYAQVEESEKAFEERCRKEATRLRDEKAAKIKATYESKIERLRDRLRREERELAEDQAEHKSRKLEEVLGIGESVAGFLLGRRRTTALTSAISKRRMTSRAAQDVQESEEEIAQLKADIEGLKQEMMDALADLDIEMGQMVDARETLVIKPRRMDVQVNRIGIGWVPHWRISGTDSRGIKRTITLPAYERG